MLPTSAAFRYRNFRLFWFGLLVSTGGSVLQTVGVLWHVATLVPAESTGLALGLLGLARAVPTLMLATVSGALADSADRRRVVIRIQMASVAIVVVLTVLSATHVITLWMLYVLVALRAAAATVELPSRQALLISLVPSAVVPGAISLSALAALISSVLGPIAAGVLIAWAGVEAVYLLNALSFCGMAWMLHAMTGIGESSQQRVAGADLGWRPVREALAFMRESPLVRSTILIEIITASAGSLHVLLPMFAREILKADSVTYGWLASASAFGGLAVSVAMFQLRAVERRGLALLWTTAVYCLAVIGVGLSRSFAAAFTALVIVGVAEMVSTILRSVVRQLETPDRLRGRMNAASLIFFQGTPRVSELALGALAGWAGAALPIVAAGGGCLIATGCIATLTPELRHHRPSETSSRGNARGENR